MPENIDAHQDNADWVKRTWDLWGTPAAQANWLLRSGGKGSPEANLAHWLKLPMAKSMPQAVKQALGKKGYRV